MNFTDKERMKIGVKRFSQAATLPIPALPVLAALSVAAALVCWPLTTQARNILVTITGKLLPGSQDVSYTVVFPPNAPPTVNDLTGKKFILNLQIDDGKVFGPATTRTSTPFVTGISSTSEEIGNTPIETATLIVDGGTQVSLGVKNVRISSVSSGVMRNINGNPVEAFTMEESYSVIGSAGYGDLAVDLVLGNSINPHLKADYGEPIYFTLAPLWSGTFYRLWEEVSNDGFIVPATERVMNARLEPHTVSITTDPKVNYTAADKAKAALDGFQWGLRAQVAGWITIVDGGPGETAKQVAQTLLSHIMTGDMEFNADNQIEISQSLVNSMWKTFTSSDPFNLLGLRALWWAYYEDSIALDPPDTNYKTVATPIPLSLPSTGNKNIDKVIADYSRAASLAGAKLHAMERFEGAKIAGDVAWAATQQSAYEAYATQVDAARVVLFQDDVILKNSLPTVDVNKYPGGAAAIAKAMNDLSGKPLPADLNQMFLSLGLTQAQINKGVSEVALAVRPSDISTDFKSLLSKPTP
jgi:hypothetical protein